MFDTAAGNSPSQPFASSNNATICKRKRRPAGTPDPDAEVVSLSPRTLMESDRYVCEICNQGFQREQNLQMHRRRHKVPWKLVKRAESGGGGEAARKRVFVCPEESCLHHDPAHALGDLVGIKKHYRRKHSEHKQWACGKCCKAYAVQSDYKAHLKTCGTRGHSCDCGRVFSRVESFIEHQDACIASRPQSQLPPAPQLSRTTSCPSPSIDTNNNFNTLFSSSHHRNPAHFIELQLLPKSGLRTPICPQSVAAIPEELPITRLQLSIGTVGDRSLTGDSAVVAAEEEKEMRKEARRQLEMAELEFENAKRIRAQAQAELSRMLAVRDEATKRISSALVEITCLSCKRLFRGNPAGPAEVNSVAAASYVSSVVTQKSISNAKSSNESSKEHLFRI